MSLQKSLSTDIESMNSRRSSFPIKNDKLKSTVKKIKNRYSFSNNFSPLANLEVRSDNI